MTPFFTGTDYLLSLPMILLSLFALGILIIDLMLPAETQWLGGILPLDKRTNAITALIGIGFATAAVAKIQGMFHAATLRGTGVYAFTGFAGSVLIDRFALYFFYLFLAGAAVAILISIKYLEIERENHGEFYALVLFSVVGMMCMACGYDVVLLFIGLELMALSTYVLVGFLRRDRRSNAAALKRHMAQNPRDPVVVVALITTATGLLFKIAAVPFHQWAPDAYEGAPTSVTGYMSVAVKAAAWALLLRVFLYALFPLRSMYVPLLIFVALATMTGGNFAALTQNNLKRLLAYSSISHVGYMLLGLVASDGLANKTGIQGILIYVLVYTFMNLGAFAVITSLRRRDIIGDEIDDIQGLVQKAPVETFLMLVFLLSLAGIPPLAGFYGKYFIFLSLIQTQHYILAGAAVLYAVLGAYYYLRIANAMIIKKAVAAEPVKPGAGMWVALGVTGFATTALV